MRAHKPIAGSDRLRIRRRVLGLGVFALASVLWCGLPRGGRLTEGQVGDHPQPASRVSAIREHHSLAPTMAEPRYARTHLPAADADIEAVAAAAGGRTDAITRLATPDAEAPSAGNGSYTQYVFGDSDLPPSVRGMAAVIRHDMGPDTTPATHDAEATIAAQIAKISDSAAQRVFILERRHDFSDPQRSAVFFAYVHEFAQRQGVIAAVDALTDPVSGPPLDTSTPSPSVPSSAIDETVYSLLAEDQQEEYADAAVDRDLWWTEMIGQLAADIGSMPDREATSINGDAAVSMAAAPSTTDAPPAAADANPHPGGNLFDLLNP